MSLSILNQDPIACISVFLNALEIKNIHSTNTYLKNCVHEKNEKNKQKNAFIMGGLHSMEHAPLQYFMLNKSFDQNLVQKSFVQVRFDGRYFSFWSYQI